VRAGEPNPTRPAGGRARSPSPPSPVAAVRGRHRGKTDEEKYHPSESNATTRRRVFDAPIDRRSIDRGPIADRSRHHHPRNPGRGVVRLVVERRRDARATARSSSLPSPTAGGEKMTRIVRFRRRAVTETNRRRASGASSSGIPPIADDGDDDDGALEESTPRALYPVPVVRRPWFSLLCFSIELFAVARSRSHRRAVEVARTIVGSLRVRECRAPATSRPRPLVPSIYRHPSDPSDLSIHPSDLTDPKIGSCRPVYCIVLCTSTM